MSEAIATESTEKSGNAWRSVTRWLVILNVAIFGTDLLLWMAFHYTRDVPSLGIRMPFFVSVGYFSYDTVFVHGKIWRFFSYQFCHANVEHLLVNMMGLLLAGPIVEERLGRAKYLLFYLACGAVGPLAHIALTHFGFLNTNGFTPLIGASASIYGVLVAAARIAPNEIVELAFPPIDMKLRTLAWVLVGLSAAAVLWNWDNAGGHAAHIGGAVMGWILAILLIPKPVSTSAAEVQHQ